MIRRVVLAVAVALVPGLAGCAAATPTMPGRAWQVERVLTDPALSNSQARYFTDDPRLLGRFVSITTGRAEIDDGGGACTRLTVKTASRPAATVLKTVLPVTGDGSSLRAMMATLGLSRGATRIPVSTYACTGPGDVPPGRGWTGAASFPLSGNRLALVWDREAMLVLGPIPATIPKCPVSAGQPKAICADPGLAAWHRSVERAYAIARDGGAELGPVADRDALEREQAEWRARRDRCGQNPECLRDSMSERTEQLLQR